jgi:hypothetical protein
MYSAKQSNYNCLSNIIEESETSTDGVAMPTLVDFVIGRVFQGVRVRVRILPYVLRKQVLKRRSLLDLTLLALLKQGCCRFVVRQ